MYVSSMVGPIDLGSLISLGDESSHYLANVMRMTVGKQLRVFDGIHGEYLAEIHSMERRGKQVGLRVISRLREMPTPEESPIIRLIFAPIKRTKLKSMLCAATELGVSSLVPLVTSRADSRYEAAENSYWKNILESCEQCERLTIPAFSEQVALDKFIKATSSSFSSSSSTSSHSSSPSSSSSSTSHATELFMEELGVDRLIVCVERSSSSVPILSALHKWNPGEERLGLLVGPEGGFSSQEVNFFDDCCYGSAESGRGAGKKVEKVSLGNSILRAETAGAFVMSCATAVHDNRS